MRGNAELLPDETILAEVLGSRHQATRTLGAVGSVREIWNLEDRELRALGWSRAVVHRWRCWRELQARCTTPPTARVVTCAGHVADILRLRWPDLDVDRQVVVALGNRNRYLGFECVAARDPCELRRSVLTHLIRAGAVAGVVAFTGTITPADIRHGERLLYELWQPSAQLGIAVVDVVLVSNDEIVSITERLGGWRQADNDVELADGDSEGRSGPM